jgi:hypothetical protein
LHVRPIRLPLEHPRQTASGTITESPLVLTDALIDNGVIGHSIVFTYSVAALRPVADLVRSFEALVQGDPLCPAETELRLARRFRLLGTQGLVGIALAAIDMALWDALARTFDTSLVRMLGGFPKPIREYGAVGYDGVGGSGRVAEDWVKRGFGGTKAKIGYRSVERGSGGRSGHSAGGMRPYKGCCLTNLPNEPQGKCGVSGGMSQCYERKAPGNPDSSCNQGGDWTVAFQGWTYSGTSAGGCCQWRTGTCGALADDLGCVDYAETFLRGMSCTPDYAKGATFP